MFSALKRYNPRYWFVTRWALTKSRESSAVFCIFVADNLVIIHSSSACFLFPIVTIGSHPKSKARNKTLESFQISLQHYQAEFFLLAMSSSMIRWCIWSLYVNTFKSSLNNIRIFPQKISISIGGFLKNKAWSE